MEEKIKLFLELSKSKITDKNIYIANGVIYNNKEFSLTLERRDESNYRKLNDYNIENSTIFSINFYFDDGNIDIIHYRW